MTAEDLHLAVAATVNASRGLVLPQRIAARGDITREQVELFLATSPCVLSVETERAE